MKDELEGVSGEGEGGTLAVIVPPSLLDAAGRGPDIPNLTYGHAGRDALDEALTLLTIEDAKGLEFDSVTVVEPARIVRETPQGLRALYVAFTRATRRLVIVHSEAMPAPLAGAIQHTA